MSLNPPLLHIEDLHKSYGDTKALSGVSLKMVPGEILGLLGPNGAGKTTCLRILMGQMAPSGGRAKVSGLSCTQERHRVMTQVGYVPDEPHFFDDLKGSEVLNWSGSLRGLSPSNTQKRATPLLERLELTGAMAKPTSAFSLGMKKKLALTLALLHAPALLILDEPTAGLDPKGIDTLLTLLKERRSAGGSVLYSTHLLTQAQGICDRVAILKGGVLLAQGTLPELSANLGGKDDHPQDLPSIFFSFTQGEGAQP